MDGCQAACRSAVSIRLTRTFTSMREPKRLMMAMRRSTVKRPRSALRTLEKSAAAIEEPFHFDIAV